jgi:hypothetical protein
VTVFGSSFFSGNGLDVYIESHCRKIRKWACNTPRYPEGPVTHASSLTIAASQPASQSSQFVLASSKNLAA